MSEDQVTTPVVPAVTVVLGNETKSRLIWLLILVVAGVGIFFTVKTGVFASSVGTQLDQPLSAQFAPVIGNGVIVTCPPDAKFYAGATIVCNVIGVDAHSFMPHAQFVDVVVGTHGQYHALPVNGF